MDENKQFYKFPLEHKPKPFICVICKKEKMSKGFGQKYCSEACKRINRHNKKMAKRKAMENNGDSASSN